MPDYAIDRIIARVREETNEPSVDPKFTDARLVHRIQDAYADIIMGLNTNRDDAVVASINVSFANGSTLFLLPPTLGEIIAVGLINSTTGLLDWEILPGSRTRIGGPGFVIEENMIRLLPTWQGADNTVTIKYLPSGPFSMHYGTAAASAAASLTLASTPTLGDRDTRANAYVGAVVRLVSDSNNIVQERTIATYDNTTRVITPSVDFSPTPAGTVYYEILPSYHKQLERLVALWVSMELAAVMPSTERYTLLERRFLSSRREFRSQLTRRQNVLPDRFEPNTRRGTALGRQAPYYILGG